MDRKTVFALLCVGAAVASGWWWRCCLAHVALTFPPARRFDLDFLDNVRTKGPCGMPRGDVRTSLLSGSTLNVTWHLAYPHRGGHRIELLDSNARVLADLTNLRDDARYVDIDSTAQFHEVALPPLECRGCTIRLLRQASEWSRNYRFWSCADVDILLSRDFRETCSGAGRYVAPGECVCDPRREGTRCQYENECAADGDCGAHGKCVGLDATSYPRRQCFCEPGWFGERCQKESPLKTADMPLGSHRKKALSDEFTLYWKILEESSEIEIAMVVRGTSYAAVGWRPGTIASSCKAFPLIVEQRVAGPRKLEVGGISGGTREPEKGEREGGTPAGGAHVPTPSGGGHIQQQPSVRDLEDTGSSLGSEPRGSTNGGPRPPTPTTAATTAIQSDPEDGREVEEKEEEKEMEEEEAKEEEEEVGSEGGGTPEATAVTSETARFSDPGSDGDPTGTESPTAATEDEAQSPGAKQSRGRPYLTVAAEDSTSTSSPLSHQPPQGSTPKLRFRSRTKENISTAARSAKVATTASTTATTAPTTTPSTVSRTTRFLRFPPRKLFDRETDAPRVRRGTSERVGSDGDDEEERGGRRRRLRAEEERGKTMKEEEEVSPQPAGGGFASSSRDRPGPLAGPRDPLATGGGGESGGPLKDPPPPVAPSAGPPAARPEKRDLLPEPGPYTPRADFHPMDCTDIVIGAARGPYSRVLDFYTRDRSTPRVDSFWGGSDDLTAAVGQEKDGITTIVFRRRIEASEPTDHAISNESMLVIWARGQEANAYVHHPKSGLETGTAGRPDFYGQDELKYHGQRSQRGKVLLNFFADGAAGQSLCGEGRWAFPAGCEGRRGEAAPSACEYVARWTYLRATDDVHFVLQTTRTDRWTGIGFSDHPFMPHSDAIIGWVDLNGRVFVADYWIAEYATPQLDTVQHIYNVSGEQKDGITTLRFSRRRDTGDEQDKVLSDTKCLHVFFIVHGGTFNPVNKKIRKHDVQPIVSEEKICFGVCDKDLHDALDGAKSEGASMMTYNVSLRFTGLDSPRLEGDLSERIQRDVTALLKDAPGFREANVLVLHAIGDSAAETVKSLIEKTLGDHVSAGKLGSLAVDPHYLMIQGPIASPSPRPHESADSLPLDLKVVVVVGAVGALLFLVLLQAACTIYLTRRRKRSHMDRSSSGSTWKDCSAGQTNYAYESFEPDSNGRPAKRPVAKHGHENGSSSAGNNNVKSLSRSRVAPGNQRGATAAHDKSTYSLPRTSYSSGYSSANHFPDADRQFKTLSGSGMQPDFYFMPSQRKYSGEVVRVYVDYNGKRPR